MKRFGCLLLALCLSVGALPSPCVFADDADTSRTPRIIFAKGGQATGIPNLYRFPARFYDADLGHWLTPDRFVKYSDPQTLNPYTYARNNPTSIIDPNGEWLQFVLAFVIKAVLTAAAVSTGVSIATGISSLYASAVGNDRLAAKLAHVSHVAAIIGIPVNFIEGGSLFGSISFFLSGVAEENVKLQHETADFGINQAPGQHIAVAVMAVAAQTAAYTVVFASFGAGARAFLSRRLPTLRVMAARYGRTLGEDVIPAGRRLSTLRQVQEGEEFIRYEPSEFTRMTPQHGLRPKTFAAPVSDGITPTDQLASRYKLPNPEIPRDRIIYGIRPKGDWVIGPRSVEGGPGMEVQFPFGTAPGSVQGGVAENLTKGLDQ